MLGELGNQKNHDRHLKSDRSGRRDILCGTLVGNILHIVEGVDYVVVSRIQPDVGRTWHEACTVKSVDLLGITYEFMANFVIRITWGSGSRCRGNLGRLWG